jgi:hypothetical protein
MTMIVRPAMAVASSGMRARALARVEPGRGLVHDQHRRAAQDGPGRGDPLALSAGQQAAALAHLGAVAAGRGGDELVGADRTGGGVDLRVGGAAGGVADVVPYRARVQQVLLLEQGDVVPEGLQGQLAEVDAIEQDPAGIRVVEAQQQCRRP